MLYIMSTYTNMCSSLLYQCYVKHVHRSKPQCIPLCLHNQTETHGAFSSLKGRIYKLLSSCFHLLYAWNWFYLLSIFIQSACFTYAPPSQFFSFFINYLFICKMTSWSLLNSIKLPVCVCVGAHLVWNIIIVRIWI